MRVSGISSQVSRDDFSEWLWAQFQPQGLVGIHEGTLLSADAASQGLETESWLVDSGEAPRERDWIGGQKWVDSELYFDSLQSAQDSSVTLRETTDCEVGEVIEQKEEDWDAQWKASFLGSENGFLIPPFWRILPPWVNAAEKATPGEIALKINPGAGFGTGTHETTQLCLQGIGEIHQKRSLKNQEVLDFGSGSGILSIGAALLGARVHGVEIDPLAIDNATENAKLNGVETQISYTRELVPLGPTQRYPLVIANILRPVLIEFADQLVARMDAGGSLVLSGLIEEDLERVVDCYEKLLKRKPQVRALNEWRALIWRP